MQTVVLKRIQLSFIFCFLFIASEAQAEMRGKVVRNTSQEAPVSRAELTAEINIKMQRVHQFLQTQGLEGILLSRINNFSWITAGIGDSHIVITTEIGNASLLIMKDGKKYLIANATEVSHLMEEDMKGLGFEAKSFGWYEATGATDPKVAIIRAIAGEKTIGTDAGIGNLKILENEFAALRYELTPSEIKKYRWVGQRASEAVASVCRTVRPGMTEKEIEVMTSDALMKRGLRPTVILIGTDERIFNYYHYPPQDKKLRNYAVINVCARRWGLVASVARYVYFGNPPKSISAAIRASASICAHMQAASIPGASGKDIFAKTKNWYAENGYPDYWKKIHVGGAIGYAEREWIASDSCEEVLHAEQAFAWNPFTRGALSFDTFIIHNDGIENITSLNDWPSTKIEIGGKSFIMPILFIRKD